MPSSPINGQYDLRASIAAMTLAGAGGAVFVGTEMASVGKSQLVVMFRDFVGLSGTWPKLKVSLGVGTDVIAGVEMGSKGPVWPEGPMQMCFPTMEGRPRHSCPMVGFQLLKMTMSTSLPLAAMRELQVSDCTICRRRHCGTLSRQIVSVPVSASLMETGILLFAATRWFVDTDLAFAIVLIVSPRFGVTVFLHARL